MFGFVLCLTLVAETNYKRCQKLLSECFWCRSLLIYVTYLDIGEMLRLLYLAAFNFHSMEGGNSGGDGGGLVQRLYPFMFFGGWLRRRSKSVRAAICCLDINHASENGVESFRADHRFFTSGNVEASVKTPRTYKKLTKIG